MSWIPRFKLYASDGSTLLYTFPVVQATNAPQTVDKNTVIEGFRGQGCIIISGSAASWDLFINGIFLANDYEDITSAIGALESVLTLGTKFVLTIDKTPSTTYSYNVKRIVPIHYSETYRTDYQEYQIILKANAW